MRADLIPTLGSWLLTYLLHSSLLLAVAWLLTRRWVRAAAVREIVWKAALVGGLATATLQAGLAYEPLGGALSLRWDRPTEAQPENPPVPVAVHNWSGRLLEDRPASTGIAASAGPSAEGTAPSPAATARPAASQQTPTAQPRSGFPTWLLAVAIAGWAVLAAAMAALYLLQRRRAMRRIGPRLPVDDAALLTMLDGLRRAGGVRTPIRLTVAQGLASPIALGRDEIVLPCAALTELSSEQQGSMLAHELAHLARRDPAWLAFGCVMERVFFIQPLNRVARIRLQEAAEYLCDDWAVTRTGSGVSLATCLVKVAEWVHTPPHAVPLAGMAEHRSQLVSRIHRLIEARTMPSAPRSLWFLAGAVVLVGFTAVAAPGITASGMTPQAQDTTRSPGAVVADTDTTESSLRRVMRSMRLTDARARSQARRAMIDAERSMAVASVAPMAPPRPPRAPIMAALAPRLAEFRAEAFAVGRDSRQRDTTSIAVPALIAALKDGDVEVRRAAVQSLSNLDDPRAIPAFIEALHDADPEVRSCAASGLGQFEDKRTIAPLMGALKDTDRDVRRAAISSLGNQDAVVPVDVVVAALNDKDSEIRQAALSLAMRHGSDDEHPADPKIVQAVVNLIADPNADVRSEAIGMIGDLRLTQAPAGLIAAAHDKNPDIRQHVASALGQIHDAKTVPTLRELLGDSNSDVREAAVQALGEIRDRSALEALVGALKSSDPVVRRSAAEALGQRDEEQ
ncbi:MAG: M56 family metallopeptidase [Gemmatimonadota bacterium]